MEVYITYECRVCVEGETMEEIAAEFNSMGITDSPYDEEVDAEFMRITEVHDYDGDVDRTEEFERVFYGSY